AVTAQGRSPLPEIAAPDLPTSREGRLVRASAHLRRGPPRRAASAMRGRQAGPRGRGAALLPLCGAAAAVLLFLAQGPMGWVGCSQQHPGRRGGGGRCGPVARGAVEVHEIRSRIKEDQGKSWIELNIGQMGHTANITWARHLEGARRDRLVDVSQRRRRLGEVHSPRRRGRGLGHHGLHVGREQADHLRGIRSSGTSAGGAWTSWARPNGQITTSWSAALAPIGVAAADLPAALEPVLGRHSPEHWQAFKALWAHYV
ncbi:unnamed protein product, partial [Prorocentrum cordatum]